MPTFAFPGAPPPLAGGIQRPGNAPLPPAPPERYGTGASGVRLMPVHHPRAAARLVSCYALFEWMAASKPTS